MFLLRDANESDLGDIKRLAKIFNTVNLPNSKKELTAILEHSQKSFREKIESPFEREFLFVLEDCESQKVVGTSQIMAQHGTRDAPHVYLDVFEEEKYSKSRDSYFKHKVLRLGFEYDGPTEIGGLILDPEYRRAKGKLGKQLSFVRFLFIAMHRSGFRDTILAELLPPLDEGGRSALWDALGRRFTNMDYGEADLISKHDKAFIKNLFPSGDIYASLFDKKAQDVIGAVGPNTVGVKRMLESIGFEQVARIDPFDGGPHFHARTDDLWPVQRSTTLQVKRSSEKAIVEPAGAWSEGLLGARMKKKKHGEFRALFANYRRQGSEVLLSDECADLLKLDDGDEVSALPFQTHERL